MAFTMAVWRKAIGGGSSFVGAEFSGMGVAMRDGIGGCAEGRRHQSVEKCDGVCCTSCNCRLMSTVELDGPGRGN